MLVLLFFFLRELFNFGKDLVELVECVDPLGMLIILKLSLLLLDRRLCGVLSWEEGQLLMFVLKDEFVAAFVRYWRVDIY